jgi:hypothetical protein
MDKVTQDRFKEVDRDVERVADDIKETNRLLHALDIRLAMIEGAINKPLPLWIKVVAGIVSPLVAATIIGGVVGYISLSSRLSHLESGSGSVLGLLLQQTGRNPQDVAATKQAQEIVAAAQHQNIQIPSDTVKEVGKKFLDASNKNPDAWSAALSLIDYQSYLNEQSAPTPPKLEPKRVWFSKFHWHSDISKQDAVGEVLYSVVWVQAPEAAQAELQTEPLNRTSERGPGTIVVKGGGVVLDGSLLKQVTFEGTKIYYAGGPLKMHSVTFLGCQFFLEPNQPNVGLFSAQLLQSPSVNFTAVAETASTRYLPSVDSRTIRRAF